MSKAKPTLVWTGARWIAALASWPVFIILPPLIAAIAGMPWSVFLTLVVSTMPFASLGAWWFSGLPFDGSPDHQHRVSLKDRPNHRLLEVGTLILVVVAVSAASSMIAPGSDQRAAEFLANIGAWRALLLLVCGAVGEELLCRGLLWSMLTKAGLDPKLDHGRIREWARTLIAAVIFAVLHMDMQHGLAVFPLGVLFGVARSRYGLGPAILAHVVNNVGAWPFLLAAHS